MLVLKEPGKPAVAVHVTRHDYTLSNLIGGTPTRCFTYYNKGIELSGWCDDDGISKDLPINFARPTDGWPIRGNVVVTTIGMIDGEPDWEVLDEKQVAEAMDVLRAMSIEQ